MRLYLGASTNYGAAARAIITEIPETSEHFSVGMCVSPAELPMSKAPASARRIRRWFYVLQDTASIRRRVQVDPIFGRTESVQRRCSDAQLFGGVGGSLEHVDLQAMQREAAAGAEGR